MERKIGEIFDYNGVKLEVCEEIETYSCNYCFFEDKNCYHTITGECCFNKRTDKKCVIFKLVKQ